MEFRDKFVAELGAELIVASVQKSIDEGKVIEEKGTVPVVMAYRRLHY